MAPSKARSKKPTLDPLVWHRPSCKRVESTSISQPSPFLQRSRKARTATLATHISMRLPPALPPTLPLPNIIDNDGQARQPIEVADEEDTMKYPRVWKAIVNGKENPSFQSAIYGDNELYIYMIRLWQDEVIKKAQPR